MKFLRVLFLSIFLISMFPLGMFCGDSHQETKSDHNHCVSMCNFLCFHATVLDQKIVSTPGVFESNSGLPSIKSFYQNPSLDILKRPPVVSA